MKNIILILKGFFIGIGKIIPGVSGSLIAVSLGVYDKMIESVQSFFKDIKGNSLFLMKIGTGILIALMIFSKLIGYFLSSYYLLTMAVFIGLFIGILPNIFKKSTYTKKDFALNIILILVFFLIKDFHIETTGIINSNFVYIYLIILGLIDAISMVFPGISGTAIFMLLDSYEFILKVYSELQIEYLFFFAIGLAVGILISIKMVAYFLKNHEILFYKIISYFSFYSVLLLFINLFDFINQSNIFIFVLIVLVNFFISKKFSDMEN